MDPHDSFSSRHDRYSLGFDEDSGKYYVSFPVSTGIVDYEEYYAMTAEQYQRFSDRQDLALQFVDSCHQRQHDDLLIQKPGWNRGTPV